MADETLSIEIAANIGSTPQSINQVTNSLVGLNNTTNSASGDMSKLVAAVSSIAAQMTQLTTTLMSAASGFTSTGSSLSDLSTNMFNLNNISSVVVDQMLAFSHNLAPLSSNINTFTGSLDSAARGLNDTGGGSDELKKKIEELEGKVKNLEAALKQTQTVSASLTAVFGKLKSMVAGLGIGAFIKESNDAYNVQMQNELKLEAHMKHRMNATSEQVQAIKDLASAQQQLGVIGDEIQLAGAQQLTTYAKNVSTIETLIPAMNNLIAQTAGYDATAGDATSAANMLGRALNGQYTSLKRQYGITFTEAQEQILKYGTESQKAALLVQVINDKVGNMNELLKNTPTGKMKQLSNDFGDLQEQLGATFQPLISAVLPIAREFLETLTPPVMMFSNGITAIGKAIAAVDSPGVRAIALAAAGIAVINKLRLAIGGASAGLLVLGIILTTLIGSMNETQSIGEIVSDAYNDAAGSIDNTNSELENFSDEVGEAQKAVSKLAGFDQITKLSGSSSTGSIVSSLLGDDPEGKLNVFTDAANAAKDAVKNIGNESIELTPNINLKEAGQKIRDWCESQDWQLMLLQAGNAIEEVFSGAFSIVDGLFGTNLQETFNKTRDHFFEVGKDIEGAMQKIGSGDGFTALQGVNELLISISDMLTGGLFTKQIEDWNSGWQHVGQSLYDLLHPSEEVEKKHGIYTPENTEGVINRFSPIEGAPEAAYYKWGSSGMPTLVPKSVVTSMGNNYTFSPSSSQSSPTRYDIAAAYGPSRVDVSQAPNIKNEFTVIVDGVEHDYTVTNGR